MARYLFVLLFLAADVYGQMSAALCKKNEEIVFAFQLSNKKWVCICKEKSEQYVVYRFGTASKIELEFPALQDSSSWQLFSFKGYSRGGGIQNAAMNVAFLNFNNAGVNYEVYDTWTAEENKRHIGVNVKAEKKSVDLKGVLKTQKGYLLALTHNTKIKLEDE